MSPVGFEPTVSAGERPQIYVLDRSASGTGERLFQLLENKANQFKLTIGTSAWYCYRKKGTSL